MSTITSSPSKEAKKVSDKLTLRAYRPRTQMPVTLRPLEDSTGKLYTGQGKAGYYESLTKQELEKLTYIVDHNTKVVVSDGKVINLNDPIDEINWKWMKVHPYIAQTKQDGFSNPDAVLYVDDPERDAEEYNDKTAKGDEARFMIRQLSYQKQIEAAKSLGLLAADSFSANRLLAWLRAQCDDSPEAVLVAIDPKHAAANNARIFFKEAINYKLFQQFPDGSYRFGGESGVVLGHNIDTVLDFMLNPENNQVMSTVKAKMAEKKNTA